MASSILSWKNLLNKSLKSLILPILISDNQDGSANTSDDALYKCMDDLRIIDGISF